MIEQDLDSKDKNAYEDLLDFLLEDEIIESIVFGEWDYGDPDHSPVPKDKKGCLINIEDAKSFMKGWSFNGGYGLHDCYPCYVWTNKRVIFICLYDGATWLSSVPRNPIEILPGFKGRE